MRIIRASTNHVAGPVAKPIATKTANYTLTSSDYTVLLDCTSGPLTAALPQASTCPGRIYNIKKIDSSANAGTVDAYSTEHVEFAVTLSLPNQGDGATIQSDGTAWYKI